MPYTRPFHRDDLALVRALHPDIAQRIEQELVNDRPVSMVCSQVSDPGTDYIRFTTATGTVLGQVDGY